MSNISLSECGCETALDCPHCGDCCGLHHGRVEVFMGGEEEPSELHATIHKGAVTTDTKMSGNPSPRRDGITIGLWCELCNRNSELFIWQHKGTTYLTSRVIYDRLE